MDPTPPNQQKPMGMAAVFFASAGVALLLASGFSFVACFGGFLFSGISAIFVTLVAAGFSAVVALGTALLLRLRKKHIRWRTLITEVSLLAFVAAGLLSWLDTRKQMRILTTPLPVPSELRVRCGRSILFSRYVHFTAPPAIIASMLKSKGLIEVPAEPPVGSDNTAFGSREQSKASWGWWQPTSMTHPKFFFLHHKSEAIQGWNEGWWVSGATNEVYAFIGG